MKKIQVVALGAFVALGALFTSCDGGISTNVSLNDGKDTVSYAYGVSMYQQGLSGHLQQLGVVADTAGLRNYYNSQIAAVASDPAKQAELEKEFKNKLDSVVKQNNKNLAEFLKGMQEGLGASKSKEAYHAGITIGSQISQQMAPYFVSQLYGADAKVEDKLDYNIFLSGVADAVKENKFVIENPTEVIDNKMREVQESAQAKQEEAMKAQFTEQIAAAEKFMADNKSKDGIVTLPSGLQYKVVKEGTGAKPAAADVVKVHYHGTLTDGTVFDSSVQRGEPTSFGVGQVIKGWTEALQLMPVGSKWMVYIPYNLGYGGQDRGSIPPFSTLIFEVELLDIEKAN